MLLDPRFEAYARIPFLPWGADTAGQFRELGEGVCYLTMAGVIEHAMVCWMCSGRRWNRSCDRRTERMEEGKVLTR